MSKLSKHEKIERRILEHKGPAIPIFDHEGPANLPADYHYYVAPDPSARTPDDVWSPTRFQPEKNAMVALRAYWEHERLAMLRRIMMQRRQLKFLNRAVKKRDGKLAEERLKFRETEKKLLDQLAVERDERNALEHRLYGVSNRSNPWAGR